MTLLDDRSQWRGGSADGLGVTRGISCAALAVLSLSCCLVPAGRWPQRVDLQPLVELTLPGHIQSVREHFPNYEVLAREGINLGSGRHWGYGVREFLETRLSIGADPSEMVEVRVMLFDSHQSVAPYLESFCRSRDGAAWAEDGGMRSCWTPIVESLADPMGLCMSLGVYSSFVGIQKGNLLLTFWEYGGALESVATNVAVAQVAAALSGR